jgi:hypothetical protein
LKNGADFLNGVQVGVEILTSKIRHENIDKFKNGLSKKGVEYFYLSNDTNKSIANFRETIPLICFFHMHIGPAISSSLC